MIATTFWLTGLSGSGKTTLSDLARREHREVLFREIIILDGDIFRRYVSNDLGFSIDDRKENIRRAVGLSKLLNIQGVNVISAFITPTEEIRNIVRNSDLNYKMIYLKCSIKKCIERDVKGLYRKNTSLMTGISQSFEEPINPDLVINTENGLNHCVMDFIDFITDTIERECYKFE